MTNKPKEPCDCLNICGDDPWLKDGRSEQCDAAKQRAANEAAITARFAAERSLLDAALEFGKAHVACDEMEARDEESEDAVTDHEYETTTARYNETKAALVTAYRAFISA